MSPIDKGEDAKGIYRSIYVSLWEDRDFQALDPNVKLVLLNLRMSPLSNMPCIYPIYVEAIQKHTGLSEGTIKDAIDTLCKSNWIEYEDGIVWVKKGLQFDPSISLRNDFHVMAIRKAMRSLPKLTIVDSFLEFYGISMEELGRQEPTKAIPKAETERLVNLWNVVCGKMLPKVTTATDTRIRHINARLDERPDFEFWKEFFQRIVNTPFLTGENNRGWKTNFDWVINPTNMTKILEGNWPTTQEQSTAKKSPPQTNTRNLWGKCKKCRKESLKESLTPEGLCSTCNPESGKQAGKLKELIQSIGKKIPSTPHTTLSKPEPTE